MVLLISLYMYRLPYCMVYLMFTFMYKMYVCVHCLSYINPLLWWCVQVNLISYSEHQHCIQMYCQVMCVSDPFTGWSPFKELCVIIAVCVMWLQLCL